MLLLTIGVVNIIQGMAAIDKANFFVGSAKFVVGDLTQLFIIQAYPFWSLTILAIDILALFGLVVYGKRLESD